MFLQRFMFLTVFVYFLVTPLYAQNESANAIIEQVNWQPGPSIASMDKIAEIRIPGGYVFANGKDTKLLMDAMGNPPTDKEIGFFSPETMDWYVAFDFDVIGYVKDDEKSSLDSDAMLESIRRGTEESNKIRRERGFTGLHITGWETPPNYNEDTHNLEWAIKGEDDNGELFVNHNTRILGRNGVMSVTLVVDPISLSRVLPTFREHMKGFSYQSGQKYAEFRKGDKIAKYGLTALVVGGAAAVAVKTGIFKWLWKLLIPIAIGIGALLKKLFGGRTEV